MRAEAILKARNGGSVTPAYDRVSSTYIAQGRMVRCENMVVVDKKWDAVSKTWSVTTEPEVEGGVPPIDFIYYATGAKADVASLPVMQQMMEEFPIPTVNGLPCLTDELQWTKEIPLFMAGRFAALRLGPGAANLEGARTGAERIVCRLQEYLEEKDGAVVGMGGQKDKMEDLKRGFALGSSHVNMYSALLSEG